MGFLSLLHGRKIYARKEEFIYQGELIFTYFRFYKIFILYAYFLFLFARRNLHLRASSPNEDIDNDYKYQRENLYNLIERGQDAIDGILELAKESEHPRTYEVALNGIKQVAEVTEKLADLQEKMRKLKEVPDHAPRTVNNALYVGSTAELQKMLKEKK